MGQGTATQQGTGKALGPTEAPLQRARHHAKMWLNDDELTQLQVGFPRLLNALVQGFRKAAQAGPLCNEPMRGVCFILEEMTLSAWPEAGDPFGPMSGQTLSTFRDACLNAFQLRQQRLMEAMYRSDIQCSSEQVGNLYAVLTKRRGRITEERMREGTAVFIVSCVLPVVESFGFSNQVRAETSGFANPQLVLSHWEVLPQDPFWQPTTEEEQEEFGVGLSVGEATPNLARDLIRGVRRRKGLAVKDKTVEHAEKQRTLARKK
eukprot:g67227.t1